MRSNFDFQCMGQKEGEEHWCVNDSRLASLFVGFAEFDTWAGKIILVVRSNLQAVRIETVPVVLLSDYSMGFTASTVVSRSFDVVVGRIWGCCWLQSGPTGTREHHGISGIH